MLLRSRKSALRPKVNTLSILLGAPLYQTTALLKNRHRPQVSSKRSVKKQNWISCETSASSRRCIPVRPYGTVRVQTIRQTLPTHPEKADSNIVKKLQPILCSCRDGVPLKEKTYLEHSFQYISFEPDFIRQYFEESACCG